MLKRLLMAAAVAGLMTGVTAIHADSAQAGPSGCRQMAKAKFPGDMKARHAFKKECKARWKMVGGKRGGLFKRSA